MRCQARQYSSVPLESRQVFGVLVEGCCSWNPAVEPISIVLTVVDLLMSSCVSLEYDFYRNVSESFEPFGVEPDWSAFVVEETILGM